jgi:hypothetical protein
MVRRFDVPDGNGGGTCGGQVLLIADHLSVLDRFPEKLLVYNVVWRTVVYLTATKWTCAVCGICRPYRGMNSAVATPNWA